MTKMIVKRWATKILHEHLLAKVSSKDLVASESNTTQSVWLPCIMQLGLKENCECEGYKLNKIDRQRA